MSGCLWHVLVQESVIGKPVSPLGANVLNSLTWIHGIYGSLTVLRPCHRAPACLGEVSVVVCALVQGLRYHGGTCIIHRDAWLVLSPRWPRFLSCTPWKTAETLNSPCPHWVLEGVLGFWLPSVLGLAVVVIWGMNQGTENFFLPSFPHLLFYSLPPIIWELID